MNSAIVGLLRALLVADTADFDKAMKRSGDTAKEWSKELKKTGQQAAQLGAELTKTLTVPLAGLGLGALKMATDFETSFANVAKTVGGGKDQLDALAMTMRTMAKTIPLTTDELNKIAALGGQLGVSINHLADFTKHVAMLGVAVDGLSTEEAATSLAQIGNAAGSGTRDIAQMASTLVHLGNNSAATEAQILEFTKRLVGAGTSIGLTVREVMALGTAMANVGINAEAGGSAMSKVLADIGMAVSKGGASLAEFAKVANLSAEDFAATFKRAPMEAIQAFINGLATMKARGVDLNLTMADLSETGIRTRDTLTRLAGGVEGFNKAVKDSAVGWTTANKHIAEAEIKFKTTANQLKILWSQIRDVGITIGNAMLPAINFLIKGLSALTPFLDQVAKFFAAAPAPIQVAALALAAVAAAAGPLIFMFGQLVIASSAVTAAFGKQGLAARATAVEQAALGTSSTVLTTTMGLLGKAVALLGVAWAGWEVGKLIEKNEALRQSFAAMIPGLDLIEMRRQAAARNQGTVVEGIKAETIARAQQAGILFKTTDAASQYLEAVAGLQKVETIRQAQWNKSAEAQKAAIQAELDLGRITQQVANERLAQLAVETQVQTVAKQRVDITAAMGREQEKVRREIESTGYSLEELARRLQQDADGFKAYAKEVGLSSEAVNVVERRVAAYKKTQDAARQATEKAADAMKQLEAAARAMTRLGVEDKIQELNAQLAIANRLGGVAPALWDKYTKEIDDWVRAGYKVPPVLAAFRLAHIDLLAAQVQVNNATQDWIHLSRNLAPELFRAGDAIAGLTEKYRHFQNLLADPRGVANLLKLSKGITFEELGAPPRTAMQKFTGSWSANLKAWATTIGPQIGNMIAEGIATGDWKGAAQKTVAQLAAQFTSAIPIIGSTLAPIVGALVDKLFAPTKTQMAGREADKKIDEMKAQLVGPNGLYGSFEQLQAAALEFGITFSDVWGRRGVDGLRLMEARMDQFTAAQGRAKELQQKLTDGFGRLTGALQVFGGTAPASLRPTIQALLEMDGLTGDMRAQLEGLAAGPSWQTMQGQAEALGIDLAALGPAFHEAKITDTALGYARTLGQLADTSSDMGLVLVGMQDELSKLYQDAVKHGIALPDTLKPYMATLIEMGGLVDENGEKVEDLNAVAFKEIEDEALTAVVTILEEIRDLLERGLPDAARTGAEGIQDEFRRHPVIVPYSFQQTGGIEAPEGPDLPRPELGLQGGTHGQYVDWGAGTAVTLHGKERVVPEGEIGGGGGEMRIVLQQDGKTTAEWLLPFIPGAARRLGLAGVY